jgi:uncharacterized protein (TIGR02231 family)
VTAELWQARPDTSAWRIAFESVLELGLQAARDRTAVDARVRRLGDERSALRAELAALVAGGGRKEYLVEVMVSCPAGGVAEVELSYVVGGASWTPIYEARAREGSRQLVLAMHATIRQSTGEDWRGVQLSLSTAVPRQNASPPAMAALNVRAEEREAPRKQLVARSEEVRHAGGADPAAVAASGGRATVRDHGLSAELALPEPADVPGDGTPVRVAAARAQLAADFRLRTIPRLAPAVFRVADVVNTAPFPLLAGPLELYRDGSFVARQALGETAAGARFTISFGVEERVRAWRMVLEEVERSAGLFGGTRHHRFAYRLHVASYLPRPEEVELADQLPVSELDDVKVVIDPRTAGGYALEPRDGFVRWRLRLAPGEKRALDLAFRVEAPSSYE